MQALLRLEVEDCLFARVYFALLNHSYEYSMKALPAEGLAAATVPPALRVLSH